MTDAEIAGIMGWCGPGAYSAAAMRKVRRCIDQAVREEREACADRGERGETNQKPAPKSLRDMTDTDFAAAIGV